MRGASEPPLVGGRTSDESRLPERSARSLEDLPPTTDFARARGETKAGSIGSKLAVAESHLVVQR